MLAVDGWLWERCCWLPDSLCLTVGAEEGIIFGTIFIRINSNGSALVEGYNGGGGGRLATIGDTSDRMDTGWVSLSFQPSHTEQSTTVHSSSILTYCRLTATNYCEKRFVISCTLNWMCVLESYLCLLKAEQINSATRHLSQNNADFNDWVKLFINPKPSESLYSQLLLVVLVLVLLLLDNVCDKCACGGVLAVGLEIYGKYADIQVKCNIWRDWFGVATFYIHQNILAISTGDPAARQHLQIMK